jgi:hypothetical protein
VTERVVWPAVPRDPGVWAGGPPVGPGGSSAPRMAPPILPPPPASGDSNGARPAQPAPESGSVDQAGRQVAWPTLAPPPPSMDPGLRGNQLPDRAPSWVLALSVLVLAAVVIGGAYIMVSRESDHPDRWDDRVAPLAAWAAEARGLEFEHPVYVNFLTEAEYTAATTSEAPESEEESTEIDDVVAQIRALGLVSGEVDLTESVNTLSDSGTLAFYQPSDKQIYVKGTELTPAVKVTLVHELVHVLQDQHFDLKRQGDEEEDPHTTLRAVAEGDAGRIENTYITEELSAEEREDYERESAEQGEDAVDEVTSSVPDGLTAVFTAPYVFGEPFVAIVAEADGNSGVDRALENPPSTRVLFDPRLWDTDEEEDVAVEVVVPSGVEEIESDRLGSPMLYLVLAARIPHQDAMDATDQVAGERFVSYRDGTRVCVRATARGRDSERSARVEAAFQRWAQASPEGMATVSRDANGAVQLQSCDPGPDVDTSSVSLDALALPVTRSSLYAAILQQGGNEKQAACVVDAVVPSLTPAELRVESEEAASAVQGRVIGAMGMCMAAS